MNVFDEPCDRIDVFRLRRGLRDEWVACGGWVALRISGDVLEITRGGGRGPTVQALRLRTTIPHFGGERLWVACPRCGRRVGVVVRPLWSASFACRTCMGVGYATAKATRARRARLLLERIRCRLRAHSEAPGIPPRPARMRWATYRQLVERLVAAEREYETHMLALQERARHSLTAGVQLAALSERLG